MGRTIYYSLLNNPDIPVTEKHWIRIRRLTDYFCKHFRWTCETVGFLTSGQAAVGGTKVAGDEYNAFLVTAWLVKTSKILPQHEFILHDQGRFLKIDLIIKNGLAKADLDSAQKTLFSVEKKLRQNIPNKRAYENEQELIIAAMNEFKDGRFTEISRYCRPVDPKDFENQIRYETVNIDLENSSISEDIGQSMSGYGGEYWGLISETEAKWKSKMAFEKVLELLKRI